MAGDCHGAHCQLNETNKQSMSFEVRPRRRKERDERLWRAAPWTPSRALTWGKEKHGTILGWIKAWNADLCCVGETWGWEGRTSRERWSRAHGVKAGEANSGLGEGGVKPPSVDKKTLMLWKWWEPRKNRGGRSHWLGGGRGFCLSEVTESRAESYTIGWVNCIEEVMFGNVCCRWKTVASQEQTQGSVNSAKEPWSCE